MEGEFVFGQQLGYREKEYDRALSEEQKQHIFIVNHETGHE
jgi:hypothetical protein